MKNLRTRLLLMICTGFLGLLAACGDSPATPTVVAPTATTAPVAAATATTATKPAATATTAATKPVATATTAGRAAATATTAALPAATATTAALPAATATTGGGSTTGLPAALQNAAQAMQGLKSYHFVATTDMGATGSTTVEGDVILPDKMAVTGTTDVGGQKVETRIVSIGSTMWTNTGGQWIKTEGVPAPMSPTAMTGGLTDVTAAEDLGDTTLDGQEVHHLRYAAANTGAGPVTSEIWIDKATNYIVQIKTESDSPAGKINSTTKLSRFNDPAIVIEEPQ